MTIPHFKALNQALLNKQVEADMSLAMAGKLVLPGPAALEDVSAQWVEQKIAGDVDGAKLNDFRIENVHDGMTSRIKFHMSWNEAGKAAQLPETLFVKITPDVPEHRVMLSILHMAELECNFYNELGAEFPEITPRAYIAESYPGGRFIIALEDLTGRGCTPYQLVDSCSVEHAKAIAKTLAQVHARYWDSERFGDDLVWVRPRSCRYGAPWMAQTFADAWQAFLSGDQLVTITPAMRELADTWLQLSAKTLAYWETLPQTLLHGDSHFGNTYALPDGRAGYLDWQVILRGHGLRDLCYFVFTALSIEQRRAHENEIFELYLSELAKQGVQLEREEAWKHYRLFTFDALDANMITMVHGTYGHDTTALKRQFASLEGAVEDYNLLELLKTTVA
jgi:Ecdysteroid kinase-like family